MEKIKDIPLENEKVKQLYINIFSLPILKESDSVQYEKEINYLMNSDNEPENIIRRGTLIENYLTGEINKYLIQKLNYAKIISRSNKRINELLKENVSDEKVQELADKFSTIMRNELTNKKYLIGETVEFIKANYQNYNFHIVSGSDEKELNYLCKELELSQYFKTIEGSPTCKNDLVKNILQKYSYNPKECILIGDSINDYEAANINGIKFYGYNNEELRSLDEYIEDSKDFLI